MTCLLNDVGIQTFYSLIHKLRRPLPRMASLASNSLKSSSIFSCLAPGKKGGWRGILKTPTQSVYAAREAETETLQNRGPLNKYIIQLPVT